MRGLEKQYTYNTTKCTVGLFTQSTEGKSKHLLFCIATASLGFPQTERKSGVLECVYNNKNILYHTQAQSGNVPSGLIDVSAPTRHIANLQLLITALRTHSYSLSALHEP